MVRDVLPKKFAVLGADPVVLRAVDWAHLLSKMVINGKALVISNCLHYVFLDFLILYKFIKLLAKLQIYFRLLCVL